MTTSPLASHWTVRLANHNLRLKKRSLNLWETCFHGEARVVHLSVQKYCTFCKMEEQRNNQKYFTGRVVRGHTEEVGSRSKEQQATLGADKTLKCFWKHVRSQAPRTFIFIKYSNKESTFHTHVEGDEALSSTTQVHEKRVVFSTCRLKMNQKTVHGVKSNGRGEEGWACRKR